MHDLTTLLLAGTTTVLGMMFLLWCLHLALKNAAVVDVGWTAGLGMLAVLYAWLGTGWGPRRLAVLLMVGLWSARLTLHLVARVSSEPEDARYTEIRARWKTNLGIKFFAFFMFQGVLDLLLSTPYLMASRNAVVGVSVFELLGALIWVVAVIGEAMADWQLREFKADPANKGTVVDLGVVRDFCARFALGMAGDWVSDPDAVLLVAGHRDPGDRSACGEVAGGILPDVSAGGVGVRAEAAEGFESSRMMLTRRPSRA
jgi:steroid 5-alpha reductase family enzyme